jgi:hypothetical protein
MQSFAPVLDNKCLDPGNTDEIKDFCYNFNTDAPIGATGGFDTTKFCQRRGGTYSPGGPQTGPGGFPYDEPEWGFGALGDDCTVDSCHKSEGYLAVGKLAGGGGCNGNCCAIDNGNKGSCTKQVNLGDPLSCCLRDFQCSSDTTLTGKACFSDDITNSTCPADFRATDTPGCNSIITQMCLGNLPGAITDLNLTDYDFTTLWTDPTNPDNNQSWQAVGLPSGSSYQTTQDASVPCKLNKDGTLSNSNINGGTCATHTWAIGATGAPTTYLPIPTPYKFGSLPPCQQLFWRTLYGNQPEFTNNLWTTRGQNGGVATEATSIQPQLASCGAIPFGGTPTPGGAENAERMLSAAVSKFISQGGSITASVTTVRDAPFLNWLFNICSVYPGLCSSGPGSNGVGNKFLDNVCSTVTGDDIKTNPELLKWCGCYMPDSEYTVYGNITDSVITRECTPYCNAAGVIPSFDPATGNIKLCQQSLCVIDDVTLTIAKSRVNGPITFNNICSSCSPDSDNGVNSNLVSNSNNGNITTNTQSNSNINTSISCQCIVNNFNLTSIGATIDGGINISQACNGNAKCYRTQTVNGTQQTQEVDCHSNNLSSNNVLALEEKKLMKKAEDTGNYWIILIIVITVLIIILLWLMLGPRGVPTKDITFTKTVNIQPPAPPMPLPVYRPIAPPQNGTSNKAKYF